jgi:hypothetical protein
MALGRVGRADYSLIEPYWADLFRFASDEERKARLSWLQHAPSHKDTFEYIIKIREIYRLKDDSDDHVLCPFCLHDMYPITSDRFKK